MKKTFEKLSKRLIKTMYPKKNNFFHIRKKFGELGDFFTKRLVYPYEFFLKISEYSKSLTKIKTEQYFQKQQEEYPIK